MKNLLIICILACSTVFCQDTLIDVKVIYNKDRYTVLYKQDTSYTTKSSVGLLLYFLKDIYKEENKKQFKNVKKL